MLFLHKSCLFTPHPDQLRSGVQFNYTCTGVLCHLWCSLISAWPPEVSIKFYILSALHGCLSNPRASQMTWAPWYQSLLNTALRTKGDLAGQTQLSINRALVKAGEGHCGCWLGVQGCAITNGINSMEQLVEQKQGHVRFGGSS